MEEDSTTNSNFFFFNGFFRNNHINLISISVRNYFPQTHYHHYHYHYHYHYRQPTTSNSRHSALTFAATALITFLEIKYQGKKDSPFETHPRTMYLAVSALILYVLACDSSKSRFSYGINGGVCGRILMAVLGPLFLAALLSVLLPELLCPVLFSLSILFSLFELPFSNIIQLWKWMREAIWVGNSPTQQQQDQQGGARRLATVYPNLRLLGNVHRRNRHTLPV